MSNPEGDYSSLENQEEVNSFINEEVESQSDLNSNELNGEESANTSENQEKIINTVKEKSEKITTGINEVFKNVVEENEKKEGADLEAAKKELENFKESLKTYREEFNSESINKETRKIKKKLNKLIEVAIKRAEIQVKKIEKKQKKENDSNQEKLLRRDEEKRMELQDKFKVLKQLLKFKGTWWDLYKLKYPSYAKKDTIKSEMFLELNDRENYADLEKKMIEKYGTVKNYVKSELKNLRQEYLNLNQVESGESLVKEDEIASDEPSLNGDESNEKEKDSQEQNSEISNKQDLKNFLLEINKGDVAQSNESLSDDVKSKIASSFDKIIKNEKIDSTNFTGFVNFFLDKNIDDKVYSEVVDLLGRKEDEIMSKEQNSETNEDNTKQESEFNWEAVQINNENDLKNFLNEVSNNEVELGDKLKEKISNSVEEFYLKFLGENENLEKADFFSQIFDKSNKDKVVGKFVIDLVSSFDYEKANIGEGKKEDDDVNGNQKEKDGNSNSEENDGNSDDDKKGENEKNSNHEFLNSENFENFKNFFESKIKEKENFDKIMEVMFINLTEKMKSLNGFSQGSMFEQLKDKISEWGKQLDYSLDEEEIDYLKNFPNNLEKSQIPPMLDFLIDQLEKKDRQ